MHWGVRLTVLPRLHRPPSSVEDFGLCYGEEGGQKSSTRAAGGKHAISRGINFCQPASQPAAAGGGGGVYF